MWELQRRFYDSHGARAWRDAHVPFEITSNAYIGRRYAEILLGFVRDIRAGQLGQKHGDAPLTIVELGSGSGRLGFSVASELKRMTEALGLPAPAFRLVMTDFTESNLAAFAANPRLAALADEGVLDFARVDAEHPAAFKLRRAGTAVAPGSLDQPIALIANYLFDTIRHDAFKFEAGVIHETRVGLAAMPRRKLPRRNALDALDRLALVEEHVPIRLPYYREPAYDAVLADYARRFTACEMLFPIDALRCIDWFGRAAQAPVLVLCGDKGYRTDEELEQGVGAYLSTHAKGSFSTMVNLNAIERVAVHGGGFALHAPQHDTGFTVSAFVMGAPREAAIETRFAYEAALSGLGPRHYQTTLDELKRTWSKPSIPAALSLIRVANYDQDVFLRFAPVLQRKARYMSGEVKADLIDTLEAVWRRYYPLDPDDPVAFNIGLVFYALKRHGDARTFFERSLAFEGDDAITHHNIGLCSTALGEPARALAAYRAALRRDRSYLPSRRAQAKLKALIARG